MIVVSNDKKIFLQDLYIFFMYQINHHKLKIFLN